jgi:hypothetical protein
MASLNRPDPVTTCVLELESAVAVGEPDRLGGARSVEDVARSLEEPTDPDRHHQPPQEKDLGRKRRRAVLLPRDLDYAADDRDQDDDDGHHLTVSLLSPDPPIRRNGLARSGGNM